MHYFSKSNVRITRHLHGFALLIYPYSFLKSGWIEEMKLYLILSFFNDKKTPNSLDKNIWVALFKNFENPF